MKFKIRRLIVPRRSVKVMLIVDSVVYKGEEYARAEECFGSGDNKSYRICSAAEITGNGCVGTSFNELIISFSPSDNDIYFGVNDFIKFGMIPELARRISVYAPVRRLTCSDYRKIFTDINSGILDEVSRFLSINNILLKIDSPDETADSLAEEAENLGLGGVRTEKHFLTGSK